MEKKIFRLVLISAAGGMLAFLLAAAAWAYPKTAACPIDGATAHATGKKKATMQPECTAVEYKHKGTNYSDPRNPQRFNHVFWITQCTE